MKLKNRTIVLFLSFLKNMSLCELHAPSCLIVLQMGTVLIFGILSALINQTLLNPLKKKGRKKAISKNAVKIVS